MLRFVLRRLLLVVPSLFGLLVLTFVLLRVLPNDPAAALAGENATPAQIAAIRKAYGFDEPIWKQFVIYLAPGGAGRPRQLRLLAPPGRERHRAAACRPPSSSPSSALVFATLVGIPLGTLAAVWHNSLAFDHVMRIVTVGGLAIAAFWFAIILQLVFAMELDWLPLRGRLAVGIAAPPSAHRLLPRRQPPRRPARSLLATRCSTSLLPALTLSLGGLASIARFTRAGVLDTLQKDFVGYAEARRLPPRRIIWVYVLRNSVVAAITQIGLLFGALIASAVAVEAIFDWPGIGSYAVQRDPDLRLQGDPGRHPGRRRRSTPSSTSSSTSCTACSTRALPRALRRAARC